MSIVDEEEVLVSWAKASLWFIGTVIVPKIDSNAAVVVMLVTSAGANY